MKTIVDGMRGCELGYTDQRFGSNCCRHLQGAGVSGEGAGADNTLSSPGFMHIWD
jgi:hypothetical protein